MKSPVYFASLEGGTNQESMAAKVQRLFDRAELRAGIHERDRTAIKLHFGELGNDSYINPVYVRQVVDKVKGAGALPFVTDTNTLYLGSRSNAVDHITTAILHGFAYAVVGAPVIIADGLCGKNVFRVRIEKKHFENVVIAGDINASDSMIVMSHFKAHEVAGFGGAIKNLGMGCAPPDGKRAQHKARPFSLRDRCIGCGKCVGVCPKSAITLVDEKSTIDTALCIGCFECMTVCPEHAIDINWEIEIAPFVERMVEYAYGAWRGKQGRIGFVNFLTRITPDCDCVPWSDTSIVPDIGILASTDPVAIDAASYDLVNQQTGCTGSRLTAHLRRGEDKFKGLRENTDGYLQVRYAEELGMGSSTYELIRI